MLSGPNFRRSNMVRWHSNVTTKHHMHKTALKSGAAQFAVRKSRVRHEAHTGFRLIGGKL